VKPERSGACKNEKVLEGSFAARDAPRAFQINSFVDGKIKPVAKTQPEQRQSHDKHQGRANSIKRRNPTGSQARIGLLECGHSPLDAFLKFKVEIWPSLSCSTTNFTVSPER